MLLRSVRCTAATRHLPDAVCLRYAALCSTARHRALSESANTVLSPVEELTLLTPLSTLYNKMLLDCGACLLHSTGRGRRSSGSLADTKLELAGAVHEVVRSIERTGCEACSTLLQLSVARAMEHPASTPNCTRTTWCLGGETTPSRTAATFDYLAICNYDGYACSAASAAGQRAWQVAFGGARCVRVRAPCSVCCRQYYITGIGLQVTRLLN